VKTRLTFLCFALILHSASIGLFAGKSPTANGSAKGTVHNWEYITYPLVISEGKASPSFMIGYADKKHGLRLDINSDNSKLFETNAISAQLYRSGGDAVDLKTNSLKHPIGIGNLGAVNYDAMAFFPWGTNTLGESWMKVSVGDDRYWLEIPYGFDRNPQDQLPPSMPRGRPQFASAMKHLTDHDHVVPWLNVHYDLGEIQNHWRLDLIQSNPGDGEAEVILYREDSAVGKSMYLWDLHTPRTTLRILDADGNVNGGFCVSIRLHGDGMRRSDKFLLNRCGFEDQRAWGQLEISVDNKSYRITLPTSLYHYQHGHASAK
jgi:hypothetical protein